MTTSSTSVTLPDSGDDPVSFDKWYRFALLTRFMIAGALLTAAILKLNAGPTEGWGVALHLAAIHVELLLGIWLLSGLFARTALLVASSCFLIFLSVSIYRAQAGYHSCGCFGSVEVHPWVTSSFDLICLACLLAATRVEARPPMFKMLRITVATLLILATLGYVWRSQLHPRNASAHTLAEVGTVSGNLVILEPEHWTGRPFALSDFIRDGGLLLKGNWVVVIYHEGCTTCEQAVPRYLASVKDGQTAIQLALVEIPPTTAEPSNNVHVFRSRLSADKDWFATTPVVASVQNGKVIFTVSGEDAVDPKRAFAAFDQTIR